MRLPLLFLTFALGACAAARPPAPAPAPADPAPPPPPVVVPPETVTVRDPALERENFQLRMQLLERSAELADASRRMEEATTEVVRQMARLRSLATRAEAASAIAEAEVTLQQLRGRAGQQLPSAGREAEEALRTASRAFDAENYGGAVYLATQAKRAATAARGRLAESTDTPRPGEQAFAVPVVVTTVGRTNLREAPGTGSALVTTVPAGTRLTAYGYVQDWIRVTLPDGRGAWVYQSLVQGIAPGAP
jgi:hypothetical protein